MNQSILNGISEASKIIGKTWPLYTFVASNPLSGYEDRSFKDAVSAASELLKINGFPATKLYQQAWEKGEINKKVLNTLLINNQLYESAEFYLNLMASKDQTKELNKSQELDRIMSKWLSSFLDEGLAEWEMPFKSEGFYTAWRLLAIYDSELGDTSLKEIPKTSSEALQQLVGNKDPKEIVSIFTQHLAALPGWTGYIKHRKESSSDWQLAYPICLKDYLAARLWTAQKLDLPLLEEREKINLDTKLPDLKYIWLKAWEQSWQQKMITTLSHPSSANKSDTDNELPDAQLVFCIDTRSELIRRHVEDKGNYETFGYAGFFGIAMDYVSLKDGISRKACPPIVSSAYTVSECTQIGKNKKFLAHERKIENSKFIEYFLKRMKNMLPSAFGYVEGSGLFYGLSLVGRTLLPRQLYKVIEKMESEIESMSQPNISKNTQDNFNSTEIALEEKVAIVKAAFTLMGWEHYAPLVLFVGHGSHSANNPFGSSLECGACAASPGRHNARMLAQLANLPEVRSALAEWHNIIIPDETIFVGAEHNTTTDAIILFDSEIPESHRELVQSCKMDLIKAQRTATQDRLDSKANSVAIAQKKASNWGETRPEWGLAKNAGFIIGPRNLTKGINLESRCFLHSYNWELDVEGKALEGIMQGPMVVTQWINNHYYFSTVDNDIYGGGSKITHNVTGKFGVVQGNGGDLKMGLPLQSLYSSDKNMYHQPLRLSVIVQAPVQRVSEILLRNENLRMLLDNEWIYLMVMDPTKENQILNYSNSMNWVNTSEIEIINNKKEVKIKKEVCMN